MKLVLFGIAGVAAVVVALVMCGIYAIYSAGVYMTFDEPF